MIKFIIQERIEYLKAGCKLLPKPNQGFGTHFSLYAVARNEQIDDEIKFLEKLLLVLDEEAQAFEEYDKYIYLKYGYSRRCCQNNPERQKFLNNLRDELFKGGYERHNTQANKLIAEYGELNYEK